MSTLGRRRGHADAAPPAQRSMEDVDNTLDSGEEDEEGINEAWDVDDSRNLKRRPGRGVNAGRGDPGASEDDLWDDDADEGLGGAGPRQRRFPQNQTVPTRRKRESWGARNGENIFLAIQSCLCCVAIVMCLVALLMPYWIDKLDGGVKEIVKQGDVTSLRQRMDSDPKFKVNAIGDQELSALHWATIKEKPEVAVLLLERRANINQESDRGMTPMHYAARDGHIEMTELLLGHNATIDAVDANGYTPLHWTAIYGHESVMQLLLRSGADPLAESGDRYHGTVKSLAESNRHKKVTKIIEGAEHEAKVKKAEEAARLARLKKKKKGEIDDPLDDE